jgi:gamma-glutamylcyclotransferase (GGCT)/AIG2-like uncharacterized protein YtfP
MTAGAPALLFVYGTLRAGAGHPAHALLAARGRPLGNAEVRGRVDMIDGYPALRDGDAVVRGELWEIDGDFTDLDAYEEVAAGPPTYLRVQAEVSCDDGSRVRAWLYRWSEP